MKVTLKKSHIKFSNEEASTFDARCSGLRVSTETVFCRDRVGTLEKIVASGRLHRHIHTKSMFHVSFSSLRDVSYSSHSQTHTRCPLECWPRAEGWNSRVEGNSAGRRRSGGGVTVWKIQDGATALSDQGIGWRKYRHY